MYNYQHTITYLHSTTFGYGCHCTDDDEILDISDYTITAKIRDGKGRLVTDVEVTKFANGLLHFTLAEGVKLPVKTLFMDVRLSKNNIARVSRFRVRILVERVVTDD